MEFWHRVCQTFSIHLPFVLSNAPFIFTRLLKPLETQWRRQGIPIATFFDDGIGAGSPLNSAKINSSIVHADLSHCSLEIHKEKFNWSPRENFLGLAIILTLKRGSILRAVDPQLWKCHTNHDRESVKSLTWREMITLKIRPRFL